MTMEMLNEIMDAMIRGSLIGFLASFWLMQIAGRNGHLCHIRRTPKDIISGQPRTY